ncbi:MAG TPA: hypothetical protein VMR23_11240, partial [Candidatus Limnocylindria bacterium]|nr:hypothetical protein [Candidatus Limnocylindria bacterium]
MVCGWVHRTAVVIAALSVVACATATPDARREAAPAQVVRSAAYIGDDSVRRPPASGIQAYGIFGPNEATFPGAGGSYVDDVFGTTVRRITADFPDAAHNDIYSKNGFWNADGTLMFHHAAWGARTIVSAHTGATKCTNVPGTFDGSFDPVDPDTWYWFSEGGTTLTRFSVARCRNVESVDLGRPLGALGGSVDWIDASGRYMVLGLGGVITVVKKAATVPATLPTPSSIYGGVSVPAEAAAGWIGISPDGNYVVTSGGDGYRSYALAHATATIEAGVRFWTLCGDHGDLVSASDGRTYLVTFDCHGVDLVNNVELGAAVYAVDVTKEATDDPAGLSRQRQAPNRKLFGLASWKDADGHFAGVSRGRLRDWAFVSIESSDDTFGAAVDTVWDRPYTQEIIMTNAVTGEVRRLAHHRSRGVHDSYRHQPRVSAGWGDCHGVTVGWASNFGQLQKLWRGRLGTRPYAGYSDIYAIDVDGATVPADPRTC